MAAVAALVLAVFASPPAGCHGAVGPASWGGLRLRGGTGVPGAAMSEMVSKSLKRGEELVAAGELEAALDAFTSGIKLDPECGRLYALRAETHLKMNHVAEALQDATTAKELTARLLKASTAALAGAAQPEPAKAAGAAPHLPRVDSDEALSSDGPPTGTVVVFRVRWTPPETPAGAKPPTLRCRARARRARHARARRLTRARARAARWATCRRWAGGRPRTGSRCAPRPGARASTRPAWCARPAPPLRARGRRLPRARSCLGSGLPGLGAPRRDGWAPAGGAGGARGEGESAVQVRGVERGGGAPPPPSPY
jgi:hypothetical protein